MDGSSRPMWAHALLFTSFIPGLACTAAAVGGSGGAEAAGTPCERPPCLDAAPGLRQGGLPEGDSVSLLQSRGAVAAESDLERWRWRLPVDAASQAARLARARPIGWVHVPKTGTSLANFLIHLPGMCPRVPEDYVLDRERAAERGLLITFNTELHPASNNGSCPGSFLTGGFHRGIGGWQWWWRYRGHSVIMMRQPEQRILSSYHYGRMCFPPEVPLKDELQYARSQAGCAVRMLIRPDSDCSRCGCCYSPSGPPTKEEVLLAINRLQTGFVFVGITEQWALSMCLGHRIFGGRCRLSDFMDSRLADREVLEAETVNRGWREANRRSIERVLPALEPWNTSSLRGWRDAYDGALYTAALQRFHNDLKFYGASIQSCQPCFREAGVSVSA